ncbi:MAG: hypothetical protein PHV68_01965 [Candidatus Gastranaerophilales bacterium]|nr:hypothetical protein [Candidatus Gastranaerophilales bacterium]
MAFGFTAPPVENQGDIQYIWLEDSAVDREKTDPKEWMKTGDVILKSGAEPSPIVCRELDYTELALIEDATHNPEINNPLNITFIWLIRLSLKHLNGVSLSFERVYGHHVVTEAWINHLAKIKTDCVIDGKKITINMIAWLGGVLYTRFFRPSRAQAATGDSKLE